MKAPDSKPGLITYPPSPHDLSKAIWINMYGEGEAAGPVTKKPLRAGTHMDSINH